MEDVIRSEDISVLDASAYEQSIVFNKREYSGDRVPTCFLNTKQMNINKVFKTRPVLEIIRCSNCASKEILDLVEQLFRIVVSRSERYEEHAISAYKWAHRRDR